MIKQKNVDKIKPALLEMITESGWVEGPTNPKTVLFSTPLLKRAIPKKGDRQWLDNEIFVFQIVHFDTLYFITKVIPGDEAIRSILVNALSGLDCLSKSRHKKPWVNHIGHKTNLTAAAFVGKNKSQIKDMLKHDWGKITDIVNQVEVELLKHQAEFKNAQIKKARDYPRWHRYGQAAQNSVTKVLQQPKRRLPHRSAA